MNDEKLTLRMVNELAELTRVAECVDEFCAAHAVSADCAFKLNVALEELLTNTISYGYQDAQSHEIAIAIAREGDEVVIEVSDDARPFDPLQMNVPEFETPIENRRVGGLGIHLVKTLMDNVAYAYRDGRNHMILRKRIASDEE